LGEYDKVKGQIAELTKKLEKSVHVSCFIGVALDNYRSFFVYEVYPSVDFNSMQIFFITSYLQFSH
jgi:hypothetical protein